MLQQYEVCSHPTSQRSSLWQPELPSLGKSSAILQCLMARNARRIDDFRVKAGTSCGTNATWVRAMARRAPVTMKYFLRLPVLFAAAACTHIGAQTLDAVPRGSSDSLIPATAHGSVSDANAAVFKACADAPAAHGACPLNAVFGLFKLAPNNDVLDFRASNTVPRVIDQNYGWILKLNRQTGKVRVLERMTLPESPKTWGTGGQPYGTSADRRTLSLDVTLTVYNGTVSKSWDVAKGDPPGHYLISAYVEDSAPVQFEFDVVDPR